MYTDDSCTHNCINCGRAWEDPEGWLICMAKGGFRVDDDDSCDDDWIPQK